MDNYIEKLKELYQNKLKIRKSKTKTIAEIEIEKIPYYFNKDYLKFIENKILEEKSKLLTIQYNFYYDIDIYDSAEKYIEIENQIDENIRKLKEERDKIKFSIERKEDIKIKNVQKLNDEIETLKTNYNQLPDMIDKKIIYKEIQIKRDEINSIYNNDRCIISKDMNKKTIFTVITDYEPIYGNEILANGANGGANGGAGAGAGTNGANGGAGAGAGSNGANGTNGANGQPKIKDLRDLRDLRDLELSGPKIRFDSIEEIQDPVQKHVKPKLKFSSS